MKKINIIFLTLALSTTSVFAREEIKPFQTLTKDLEAMLTSTSEQKTLSDMKAVALKQNTDVEIAFQNYLIAKKQVSIARAAFNPITTSTALGLALGMNFLWAPIALDAVLSIPMKIYDVKSNKYLETAALYNTYEARQALNNEMAHLYYDLLTHKILLKTIDEEIEVRYYQQSTFSKSPLNKVSLDYANQFILKLKIERVDIYNLYIKELAAFRALISIDPTSKQFDLAQISLLLNKSFLDGIDQEALANYAVIKSPNYKKMINFHRAAQTKLKSVKWSIITLSGFNMNYKKRVQIARNDVELARLQQTNSVLKIRNNALLELEKLDSSIDVFEYYNQVSVNSLDYYSGIYKMYLLENASDEAVVNTAIVAIQDFRNKVIAHYRAWSSFDDFSTALSTPFAYTKSDDNIQDQLEKSPLYETAAGDFKVIKKNDNQNFLTLAITSNKIATVKKVSYQFNDDAFVNTSSIADRKDFQALVNKDEKSPESFSGLAIVELTNGHEIEVNFEF